jgi:hypothetical protein
MRSLLACAATTTRQEHTMTEQTKPQPPTNVAVDLECDDEFEEFGNEGASTSRRTRNLPRSRVSPIFPTQTTRLPSSHPSSLPLTHDFANAPYTHFRRVGRRGGGRRGREAVGGGLGRHRRERRLHATATRGAAETPVRRRARAVQNGEGGVRRAECCVDDEVMTQGKTPST